MAKIDDKNAMLSIEMSGEDFKKECINFFIKIMMDQSKIKLMLDTIIRSNPDYDEIEQSISRQMENTYKIIISDLQESYGKIPNEIKGALKLKK